MTKTVLEGTMRSRPVYGKLAYRQGSGHLMVADGEGAEAILDMVATAGADAAALLAQGHIIYMPGPNGTDMRDRLAALGADQFFCAPDFATAEPRLKRVFSGAHMGMQIYLAGTEGLIGQVQRDAIEAGLPHTAMQTEHRGSTVRRVQCVHCKGITENVRHDPFKCSHCGLHLFVRDHYSRRLAAFQGVNIDAEDPGEVPPPVERFK
ncbi:MAG: dimethylamine monooxygenase subunit DmmA family protein [Paracoccaceae bacterium]